MKASRNKYLYLLALVPTLLLLAWYFIQLRQDIILAYEGKPSDLLSFLINNFYPRFTVEKERLGLAFFLKKTDQVVFRIGAVSILVALFAYLFENYYSFTKKADRFLSTETTHENIKIIRVIYYFFLILIIKELYTKLTELSAAKEFYKPILLLKAFNIPFPDGSVLLGLCLMGTILSILIILGKRVVSFSFLVLVIVIILQAWYCSFEKIDHGFVTFIYGLMICPFLFLEARQHQNSFQSWSLRLIQITIALVYFISGVEKIAISGFSWLQPETLKAYIYVHQAPIGLWLSKSDALCIFFSVSTLLFQLLFPIILFMPKYKWIFLLGGLLFHLGTLYILGIGHIFNPWVVTYIFFIDWKPVGLLLFKRGNLSSK